MIICKAPLRISVGGGGTDLPAYFDGVGTVFSSLAINKYVSVCVTKRFSDEIFIRYMKNELVSNIKDIEHEIVRTVLLKHKLSSGIEVASFADVPGGTGLGSSGAFTVALCAAMKIFSGEPFDKYSIAELATQIEMIELKRPIGLQDQYAASFGGFSEFEVSDLGEVMVKSHQLSSKVREIIKNNLLLFHVGGIRDASILLKHDQSKMREERLETSTNQFDNIVTMGTEMSKSLSIGDIDTYGSLLHEYWLVKSARQKDLTQSLVHDVYNLGIKNGALGGKLVGAGGSGFILFATKDPKKLRSVMSNNKIKELDFDICENGLQNGPL